MAKGDPKHRETGKWRDRFEMWRASRQPVAAVQREALLQCCSAGPWRQHTSMRRQRDRMIQGAVDAIVKAAHTGKIGDGKIFVTAVEQALRIRTGESGSNAL